MTPFVYFVQHFNCDASFILGCTTPDGKSFLWVWLRGNTTFSDVDLHSGDDEGLHPIYVPLNLD